jgi:hypothetical protein
MCVNACFDSRMGPTPPPEPPELAMRIACDTAARVQVDLSELVPGVRRRLRRSTGRRDWIETEAFALETLEGLWAGDLRESCVVALGDVHEGLLVQAAKVQEAIELVQQEGREAWISRAVMHELAGRLAWNVCDAEGTLVEIRAPG